MQKARQLSLNALRAFAAAARTGSLTVAGNELCVTSSAVSHQIKKLEDELGVRLFRRGSNTVSLTEAGQRLHGEVGPALALIERSANALRRDETEITVQASMSFAVRWLIPSLDRFRERCPEARVRVETSPARDTAGDAVCDVAIRYFREGKNVEGWVLLVADASRPVVAPRLIAGSRRGRKIDISGLPAIQRVSGNWDWERWGRAAGVSRSQLRIQHAFDTDDAALHACVAGLGVVLAPPILTTREIRTGLLTVLPGFHPVEIGAYRYQRRSESRMTRRFCEWMEAEMQESVE